MDEVAARRLIARELAVALPAVVDEADFRCLGADSLDLVSMTMLIEEHFDVAISPDEAEHCTTVGAAICLLRAKLHH